MFAIAFFTTVILFSLVLNAYYKIKAYNKKEKTVWQDGDSVRIKGENFNQKDTSFMKRIA